MRERLREAPVLVRGFSRLQKKKAPLLTLPLSLEKNHRVTAIEAERLEGEREQRSEFERRLRAEVERQAREKGVVVKLPPPPSPASSSRSEE